MRDREGNQLEDNRADPIVKFSSGDRLVLTHIWPHNDMDLVREQASAAYRGPLELADTAMSWSI